MFLFAFVLAIFLNVLENYFCKRFFSNNDDNIEFRVGPALITLHNAEIPLVMENHEVNHLLVFARKGRIIKLWDVVR